MRKIYLLVLACIVVTGVNAQRPSSAQARKMVNLGAARRGVMNGIQSGGGCDTLNLPAQGDSAALYGAPPNGTGFFVGVNSYGDLGDGQYFDASSTSDSYLTKTWIIFGAASTNDVTKTVPINVYDATGGNIGAVLGTTNVTMKTIINDVNNQNYTEIVFNPAIQLPASKQFLIGTNYSSLSYGPQQYDTLAIVSSYIGTGETGAWLLNAPKYGGAWDTYLNVWTVDLSLYIFAFTSPSAVCGSLPVHLTSFTAQAKGSDVLVNWQVTQELNMKEYDVERAGNNLQFVSAGVVAATNAQLDHAYSFTDAGAMANAGGLYYRLKQVNKDGSFTYSNVIRVNTNSNILTVNFANPVSNVVQLHINSPVAQKLQASIYDLLGRKVATINDQVLTTGNNFITMPTGALPKGVYILNLSAGGTAYKYKIVTQ